MTTESQLILDDHTPEDPSVISLDDACSPSVGVPAPGLIILSHSLLLSEEPNLQLANRQIVGWRHRIQGDAEITLTPSSSVTFHFAYDRFDPSFQRGDCNTDSHVDIADAIFTLSYLFGKSPAPVCSDAADANDDSQVNIADAIAILSHLFAHSGDLPPPFGSCGLDPTTDDLGCVEYSLCH